MEEQVTTETKVEASETKKTSKKKGGETQRSENTIHVKVGRVAMKRHGLSEVYVTSDGQAFAQKSDAQDHAENLEVKEVIVVK